jgi:hypothetical protein
MVSQSPRTDGSVFESLEITSRVAQLAAEIAPLRTLGRLQQIGMATGLLA